MSISRIVGLILVVVGILCLFLGFNSTQAPLDRVAETVTGRFTKHTMMYIVSGIVMLLGGAALFIGGRPKP
jgi:drug/metabolite transporter (DMT)-like permease